jgi:hypothetical protein
MLHTVQLQTSQQPAVCLVRCSLCFPRPTRSCIDIRFLLVQELGMKYVRLDGSTAVADRLTIVDTCVRVMWQHQCIFARTHSLQPVAPVGTATSSVSS